MFRKRLTMRGFIISDPILLPIIPEFEQVMPELILSGKVKSEEYVFKGWDVVPEAFIKTLFGTFGGIGKPVVQVVEDDEL